ncbi:MAG: CvpA family protein [Phycisphaerales bacterium]
MPTAPRPQPRPQPAAKPPAKPPAKPVAQPHHVAAPVDVHAPPAPETPWFHQHVVWGIVAGAGAIALAGLALGPVPIKIAAVVLALTILQGFWRGCAEIVGFVLGMLLSALLAPSLGRALEGTVASVLGTAGIINRVLSTVLVALFITLVAGLAVSVFTKRFLKQRPDLRAYDKYIGAGLGLVEGCFVALLILWVPVALRPVARAVYADDREAAQQTPQPEPTRAPAWAEQVLTFADQTSSSFVGGLVESTNPLPNARLLSLAGEFSEVSRDTQALSELLESEPMQRLNNLPSMQQALDAVRADPQVAAVLDENGVTPARIAALFGSDTMLKVLDETTLVRDAEPILADLENAIHEAKARLDERKRSGP